MPRIAFAFAAASSGLRGELDAARLAPAADEHLRLDDDGAAELGRRGARVLGGRDERARRDGQAEFGKNRPRIRFVYFQHVPPLLMYRQDIETTS